MTTTDKAVVASRLGYGISDADQHFYEAPDSILRYLEPEHRHAFRWVDVDGRPRLLLNDRLHVLVPNPTFDPVAAPGSMVEYFRGNNPDGRSLKDIAGPQIALEPSFRYREARMRVLDEQGVDLCIMLPSQALGLEEQLFEDPAATIACMRALNRWTHEEWGWNVEDRVLVAGVVSLIDPLAAEQELGRLSGEGCRVVGLRPGPVKGPGFERSPGDPIYDRFWSMVEDANVIIAFHSADTAYYRYLESYGEGGRWHGHKVSSLAEIMGIYNERPIYDTIAALIAHGAFDRHPRLKLAVLELGAGWVPPLARRLRIAYGKLPQNFRRDPVEAFADHVWVMPFYEDDLTEIVRHFPIEHVIYGSDWPHPEGLADPQNYIDDLLDDFSPQEQRLIMRDNLRALALG